MRSREGRLSSCTTARPGGHRPARLCAYRCVRLAVRDDAHSAEVHGRPISHGRGPPLLPPPVPAVPHSCMFLLLVGRVLLQTQACGKFSKVLPMRVCGKVEQTTRRAGSYTAAPARPGGCSWQCCHSLLRQTAQHYLPKLACLIDAWCKGGSIMHFRLQVTSSDSSSSSMRIRLFSHKTPGSTHLQATR